MLLAGDHSGPEIEQQEGALYQGPTVHNVSGWKYKCNIMEIQCVLMEIQIHYYRNTMYPDGNTNAILQKYNGSRWKYNYNIMEIQCVPMEIQI